MAAEQTPAGWYPDPEQSGRQRYWDGGRWTEHRTPPPNPARPVGAFAWIAFWADNLSQIILGLIFLLLAYALFVAAIH